MSASELNSEIVEEWDDDDAWNDEPANNFSPIPQDSPKSISLEKPPLSTDDSIPAGYKPGLSLLEQVLEGKSDVFASKVINLMIQCGIEPDDPMFLMLLAMGEMELMLINTPYHMEDVSVQFGEQLGELFQQYFGASEAEARERFKTALQEEKVEIAAAAKELIVTTKKQQFEGNLSTMAKMFAPALGVVIGCISIGVMGTLQYHKLKVGSLIGTGKLTPEQYEALQWAESEEGKLGRKIMELNKGYVGKTCKADAEAMGIKLQVGKRKVKSGFCTLFIDEVNKRKYE